MTDRELLTMMTEPSRRLIEDIRRIPGDILILGCGGKVGPSLAIQARRAIEAAGIRKDVIGASLFDYEDAAPSMLEYGVKLIEADLFDPDALRRLPDVPNIVFMVGRKFGTYKNQTTTWAINAMLPCKICERFPNANIVAFSTTNIYGNYPVAGGGCVEDGPLNPIGEYSQTCLGRERLMEHFSRKNGTPMLFFRLNYAIDLRYGVLYDIARNVLDGTPINLDVPLFACIWQGDANEYAIRSLLHCDCPPNAVNVSGPETISTLWAANEMGKLLGREPVFSGSTENGLRAGCIFPNTTKLSQLMGYPTMALRDMMQMVAEWIMAGGRSINAPTHFESTDGKY